MAELLARWRAWRAGRRMALMPEAAWHVDVNDDAIVVRDASGSIATASLAELAAVVIETDDSGPWGSDLWWLCYRADGTIAAGWPQGSTGERVVHDRLMQLHGFDHGRMIAAMGSTDVAQFIVWRRGEEP